MRYFSHFIVNRSKIRLFSMPYLSWQDVCFAPQITFPSCESSIMPARKQLQSRCLILYHVLHSPYSVLRYFYYPSKRRCVLLLMSHISFQPSPKPHQCPSERRCVLLSMSHISFQPSLKLYQCPSFKAGIQLRKYISFPAFSKIVLQSNCAPFVPMPLSFVFIPQNILSSFICGGFPTSVLSKTNKQH